MSSVADPLLLIAAGLRGGFVTAMLLLASLLLRTPAATATATRLAALVAIGSAAYALQSALLGGGGLPLWQWPLQALAAGNPVALWLLALALFDDGFRLRPWQLALWGAWVAAGLANCSRWHLAPVAGLLEAGPLLFGALALWPLLRSWRDDLVEARLRLRWRILLAGVGYAVVAKAAGLPAPVAMVPPWLALADAALLLVLGLGVAWPMLALRDAALLQPVARPMPGPAAAMAGQGAAGGRGAEGAEGLGPPQQGAPVAAAADDARAPASDAVAATAAADPADPAALSRLARAMDADQAWRREGLTIGQLAAQLNLPEYRLRRAINQQLGHRNFNSYLNGYRIAAVKQALADPAQAETPVLTLALAAGFQSLGPFNRAFRADTGMTPTEFRRQALAAPPVDAAGRI